MYILKCDYEHQKLFLVWKCDLIAATICSLVCALPIHLYQAIQRWCVNISADHQVLCLLCFLMKWNQVIFIYYVDTLLDSDSAHSEPLDAVITVVFWAGSRLWL